MRPPSSFGEGSSNTVVPPPEITVESPGPYDTLFHAICPPHPGKPPLDRPPRVPAATRKLTPIRPVYDDFATAHSSITSGSAKAPSTATLDGTPKKRRSLIDRGLSLSQRAHKSMKLPRAYARLDGTPRMPTTAKTVERQAMSEFDFEITGAKSEAGSPSLSHVSNDHLPRPQLQKKASSAQFFSSLKKALSSKSSSSQKPNRTPIQSSFQWPRDSLELVSVTHAASRHTSEDTRNRKTASLNSRDAEEKERRASTNAPNNFSYPLKEVSVPLVYNGGDVNCSHKIVSDDEDSARTFQSCDLGAELAIHGNENDRLEQGEWERPTNGNNQFGTNPQQRSSILREGSTVDNIVNQYAGNDQLWNVRLESDDGQSGDDDDAFFRPTESEDQVYEDFCGLVVPGIENGAQRTHQSYMRACQHSDIEHPVHSFKLTESPGRAPTTALPLIPSIAGQHTVPSSSGDLATGSSYGDTRKLLGFTESSGLIASDKEFHHKTTPSNDPPPQSKNPFRRSQSAIGSLQSFVADDTLPQSREIQNKDLEVLEDHEYMADSTVPQLALDRDVSRALHRMSAFSNFSQETSALNQGDGGFQSSTDSGGLSRFMEKGSQPALDTQRPVLQKFYHESAIRQTWLNSDGPERLRIPIIQKGITPNSGLTSNLHASGAEKPSKVTRRDESGDEWETVVDAGVSSRGLMNISGALDNFNQAGSSLANTSDDGSVGPQQYEHNDFVSTDRIIQHPAQIAYSHDYRYRETKEGNFPVLLPLYKSPAINGFPANSFRSMNPFQERTDSCYQNPSSLEKNHMNPFRSIPPEAINKRQDSLESFYSDVSKNVVSGISMGVQPVDYDSDNWMDAFDGPGPSIKVDRRLDAMAINHSDHFSPENSHSDSRTIGSSIADASSSTLGGAIRELVQLNSNVENDGLQSNRTNRESACCDGYQSLPREKQPLIKGPPGAFYQGLRSQPESRRKVSHVDRHGNLKTPQRSSSSTYPTNQIRPLSLLKAPRLRLSAEADARQLEEGTEGDFPYRSPLAPIRSRTWRDLYTREQLGVLRKTEKRDRNQDLDLLQQQTSRRLFGSTVGIEDSWRHLPCSPRIQTWPRENSSITTNASRKTKLSTIVFCLCCLFPPLLLLYGAGYLDNMMLWMTDGDIRNFKKGHKRLALQVVCFFIIATVVAVPIVVAVRISHSRVS